MASDTRNKRTPTERAVDLAALQTWLSLGWSVVRMTEELARTRRYKLSERQVFSDVRRALADMTKRSARELFAEREVQAARHLLIYAESMESWEKSKAESVKTSQESVGPHPDGPAGQGGARGTRRAERHNREGDVRFLLAALAALEARSRLLGLCLTPREHRQNADEPGGDHLAAVPGAPPRDFTIRLEMTEMANHSEDLEDRVVARSPVPAPKSPPVMASPSRAGKTPCNEARLPLATGSGKFA